MEYQRPLADLPDAQVPRRWWKASTIYYGGREAEGVVSWSGDWWVFRGVQPIAHLTPDAAGSTPPDLGPAAGWLPLTYVSTEGESNQQAECAHRLRDLPLAIAAKGGLLGLVVLPDARQWHWAYGMTLLGFYPPAFGWDGSAEEWQAGVEWLGERPARRVRRALLDRLMVERRRLRDTSTRVEAHWR